MYHLDEEAAKNTSGEGAEEDGYLTTGTEVLHKVRVGTEGECVNKDAHGEADAAEAGYGEEHGPSGAFRHFAYFTFNGKVAGEGDADGFA